MKRKLEGFTLLEILIFVTLISLVFVAISFLATYSLTATRVAQQKVIATHYAEELQEWMRGEKEVDWKAFLAKSSTPGGTIYCVNSIPTSISALTAGGCGSAYDLASQYKREVTLTGNSTDTQVSVSIVVEWKENKNILKVPVSTIFSVWE
jgi:type II secretory pathway pseudopilin PulG